MRLWPRSIAGRATLTLIAGVLAVLCAGAMVWWLSIARGDGPPGSRITFESIASVAALVDRLPPELRAAALQAATTDDYGLDWTPDQRLRPLREGGWEPRWIKRQLRHSLEARGLSTVEVDVAAGHPGADRSIGARVRLSDGSWLIISVRDRMHGPPRLIAFVSGIGVVALGLAGLAILVVRRVTAPLGRFSAAAARLGTDVKAPPMEESGPTEIREAAEAFNQMQRRIRRFVDDRTRMLAAISHDLRTMLTRFRLRSEYIDDDEQRTKALADLAEMQTMLDATLSVRPRRRLRGAEDVGRPVEPAADAVRRPRRCRPTGRLRGPRSGDDRVPSGRAPPRDRQPDRTTRSSTAAGRRWA